MKLLNFQSGNAKLAKNIFTFSLPSGHACPFANNCLSKVNRETGKLSDGPNTQFRCFSATSEAQYGRVRDIRFGNFDLLRDAKTKEGMVKLLIASIPAKAMIVRVHVAGDFFNQTYFDAWMKVAEIKKNVIFYAYTKSLPYWVAKKNEIPSNFKLTASKGGKHDNLIAEHNLKFAEVVYTEQEAIEKNLEIDHTDELAFKSDKSFALIIHGTQPAGSAASKALQVLRKQGKNGYNKKTKVKELVTA